MSNIVDSLSQQSDVDQEQAKLKSIGIFDSAQQKRQGFFEQFKKQEDSKTLENCENPSKLMNEVERNLADKTKQDPVWINAVWVKSL